MSTVNLFADSDISCNDPYGWSNQAGWNGGWLSSPNIHLALDLTSGTSHYIDAYDQDGSDFTTVFGLQNPGLTGVINSVTMHYSSDAIWKGIVTHGSTYNDVDGKVWTVNPNTGVAWTWAEIDALNISYQVGGHGSDSHYFVYYFYITVNYTPPSAAAFFSFMD